MLVLLTEGDNTVTGAAVVSPSVLLHQVTDVDDETALDYRYGDPVLSRRVPNLQALGSRLLQQDGDCTEVGVGSNWMERVRLL